MTTLLSAFPTMPTGIIPFRGNQSMGGNSLTNLADPTNNQDAATKKYVDDNIVIPRPRGLVTLVDAGTVDLDFDAGDMFVLTLGGNRTLTVSNVQLRDSILVVLWQDGTGERVVTWPANISWAGGVTPTLTETAEHGDSFNLVCYGFSSEVPLFLGYVSGQNFGT